MYKNKMNDCHKFFSIIISAILLTFCGCKNKNNYSNSSEDKLKIVVIGNAVPSTNTFGLPDVVPLLPQESAKGEAIWYAARAVYEAEDEAGQLEWVRANIELVGVDDGGNPAYSRELAWRIASDRNVLAVIGTTASSTTIEIARVVDRVGIPVLMPVASSPLALRNEDGTNLENAVRLIPADHRVQAPAVAGFARRILGGRSIALVVDGRDGASTYSRGLCDAIKNHLETMGARVETYSYDSSVQEGSAIFSQIYGWRTEVAIACSYTRTAQLFLNAISDGYTSLNRVAPPIVLTDGALAPTLDPNGLDVYVSFPLPPPSEIQADFPGVDALRAIVEESESLSYEAYSFDAMRLVGHAIVACREAGVSRSCVSRRIRQTANFPGAVSNYTFNEGENEESGYFIYRLNSRDSWEDEGQIRKEVHITRDSIDSYARPLTDF